MMTTTSPVIALSTLQLVSVIVGAVAIVAIIILKKQIQDSYFIKPKEIFSYNDESKELVLIDKEVSDCFRVKKLVVKGKISKHEESFFIGIVTKGKGTITDNDRQYPVKYGDKFLVPFKTEEISIESRKGMEIYCALPPL